MTASKHSRDKSTSDKPYPFTRIDGDPDERRRCAPQLRIADCEDEIRRLCDFLEVIDDATLSEVHEGAVARYSPPIEHVVASLQRLERELDDVRRALDQQRLT